VCSNQISVRVGCKISSNKAIRLLCTACSQKDVTQNGVCCFVLWTWGWPRLETSPPVVEIVIEVVKESFLEIFLDAIFALHVFFEKNLFEKTFSQVLFQKNLSKWDRLLTLTVLFVPLAPPSTLTAPTFSVFPPSHNYYWKKEIKRSYMFLLLLL